MVYDEKMKLKNWDYIVIKDEHKKILGREQVMVINANVYFHVNLKDG